MRPEGEIARWLSDQFGIELIYDRIQFDGGDWWCVRPSISSRSDAFSIVEATTPFATQAHLRLDPFARPLAEFMLSRALDVDHAFYELAEAFHVGGVRVLLTQGGVAIDRLSELRPNAGLLGLECFAKRADNVGWHHRWRKDRTDAMVACLSLALCLLELEPTDVELTGRPEGSQTVGQTTRYERSPQNRAAALSHFGAVCQCCGLSFRTAYGELGEGFIEIHHRVPVSQLGDNYVVRPLRDLVPLCSNCHSMVHRREPPVEVEVLRAIMRSTKQEH